MRYPIIAIILVALLAFMPTQKAKPGESRGKATMQKILTADEQKLLKARIDEQLVVLQKLPPLHQLLLISTVIILLINAAVILAYLVNSLAAVLGMGLSLLMVLPPLLLALVWKPFRKDFHARMKRHAEFGPFVSKWSIRLWRRRFRRAAREHGFASQYSY